jgi:hypothetical protein
VFLVLLALVLTLSVGLAACGGAGEQQEEEEEGQTYDLTIASTGGGSVTSPGEGTAAYDEGTVVNLEATPDAYYRFVNWTGDLGTIADINAASTTIIMSGDYFIAASFEVIPMVDAGWAHTVGLRADATVVAEGANDDGQCVVGGWTDIVQIAAGGGHTVGLKADGTVVATGNNVDGQCDVGEWTNIV